MNTETIAKATEPITISVDVNTPVSKVWKAITDKNEMKQWYFDIEEFKPEVGFRFKMFGEKDKRKFPISCKIKDVQEGKKLSYTWSYDDFPAETIVTFELQGEGNRTTVSLTHEGLDKIPPVNKDVSIESHIEGWNSIVGKLLKNYLEKKPRLFVIKSIDINTPALKVWDVLTKPELTKQWIKEWWPEISELESDWRLGSSVNWRVADGKIGAHGKISIVEPYKLLRFSFKTDEPPQQEDVTYRLEEREGRTILSISIGDFGDTAEHEQCYPKAVESWDKSLLKIKEMAEPTL